MRPNQQPRKLSGECSDVIYHKTRCPATARLGRLIPFKPGVLRVEILKELLSTNTFQGKVDWIGISSGPRSEIQTRQTVRIVIGGVENDHHCRPTRKSKRQVTLIQAEHIPVVEAILGRGKIDPSLLRRNIVVSGINLAALKYQTFRIGTAVLEGSGNCPPCSRMEENLGPVAMRPCWLMEESRRWS